MTIRDREVLDLLREEPELLAIADAVAETQHPPRRIRRGRALVAIALGAAALFALVLASPWERAGNNNLVLDRALAAIQTRGPVLHVTIQFDFSSGSRPVSISSEIFYDKGAHLMRILSRSKGKILGDYTTVPDKEGLNMFPGLLEEAGFYRQALASGKAKVVDEGFWQGRPVYWLEVDAAGGPGILRVGVDRRSYHPVVFQGLGVNHRPAGFQVAVLGFDYVSTSDAAFQTNAPVLVFGRAVGADCRPVQARVGVFLSTDPVGSEPQVGVEVASVHTGPDGRFTLRADPTKSPFREALAKEAPDNAWLNFDLNAQGEHKSEGFGYWSFSRFMEGGKWWQDRQEPRELKPITITVAKGNPAKCQPASA